MGLFTSLKILLSTTIDDFKKEMKSSQEDTLCKVQGLLDNAGLNISKSVNVSVSESVMDNSVITSDDFGKGIGISNKDSFKVVGSEREVVNVLSGSLPPSQGGREVPPPACSEGDSFPLPSNQLHNFSSKPNMFSLQEYSLGVYPGVHCR